LIAEPCSGELVHEYRKSAPVTYWDFLCTGKFSWIELNGEDDFWTDPPKTNPIFFCEYSPVIIHKSETLYNFAQSPGTVSWRRFINSSLPWHYPKITLLFSGNYFELSTFQLNY